MSRQALFDFDGTITSKDTTSILLIELVKARPWRCCYLTWFVIRLALARTAEKKQYYKNRAIGHLVHGLNDVELREILNRYNISVKLLFRPTVLASLEQLVHDGCAVLVVTASPTFAIQGCMKEHSVEVLGTEFEKHDGIYSGRLNGENCFGQEKVKRIKRWAKAQKLNLNIEAAWSDHISDLDMLNLSEKRYWICDQKSYDRIKAFDPDATLIRCGPN